MTEKRHEVLSKTPFFSFLETGLHYVAYAGLELTIFLPQPPECWDYRCAPLYLPMAKFSMLI
jgi:hypothetical protein